MSSSGFAALCSAFGKYDVVHIHAEGPAFFAWLPKLLGKRVVVTIHVDVDSLVSMNMWGLTPDFLTVLEEGFKEFFEKEVPGNPLKAEYLIPIFIGELLEQGKMSVKVLKTNDTWYGMTYHEDVAAVKDSFKKMLENGVYKADLFSDL